MHFNGLHHCSAHTVLCCFTQVQRFYLRVIFPYRWLLVAHLVASCRLLPNSMHEAQNLFTVLDIYHRDCLCTECSYL